MLITYVRSKITIVKPLYVDTSNVFMTGNIVFQTEKAVRIISVLNCCIFNVQLNERHPESHVCFYIQSISICCFT